MLGNNSLPGIKKNFSILHHSWELLRFPIQPDVLQLQLEVLSLPLAVCYIQTQNRFITSQTHFLIKFYSLSEVSKITIAHFLSKIILQTILNSRLSL